MRVLRQSNTVVMCVLRQSSGCVQQQRHDISTGLGVAAETQTPNGVAVCYSEDVTSVQGAL